MDRIEDFVYPARYKAIDFSDKICDTRMCLKTVKPPAGKYNFDGEKVL